MGGHMNRKAQEPPSAVNVNPDAQFTNEPRSYEAACRIDADLQSFDTTLQARTHQVITTLAAAVEVRPLSFDSLKENTECLLEIDQMNQEAVKFILECKKDVWKNQELFELVQEYFENSLQTLEFCAALEKCLKRARDSQLLILVALQQFEEEKTAVGNHYVRTLRELKNFKTAGNPFTEELVEVFQSVYRQQIQMIEKLQLQKHKLNEKLKSIQTWRKISNVRFVATFASVVTCSDITASSIQIGLMGKWIDSLWMNYETALKDQKDVIYSILVETYVFINYMKNIHGPIHGCEIVIESLLQGADYAIEKEVVVIGMEEIKKKLGIFMKTVEDLGLQADMCSRDNRSGKAFVLQRIIKHPNY